MGKGAPAPDYSAVAGASVEAANIAAGTAANNLAWAKEQYEKSSGTQKEMYADYMKYLNKQIDQNDAAVKNAQNQSQQVIDQNKELVTDALDTSKTNKENAAKDRSFYEDNYQPLEKEAIDTAEKFGSDEYKAQQRGRVQAQVAQSFDQERQNSIHMLEGFGIDPSSTRYAALDIGLRAQKAASMAAAANTSDLNTDAIGRALKQDAINIGRGYPSSVAQSYGTALGASGQAGGFNNANAGVANGAAQTGFQGSGAGAGLYAGGTNIFNAGVNAGGTYGNLMGGANSWANTGNQAIANWGTTVNNQGQYNASQSSGLGSMLGLIGAIPGLSEGGVMPEGGAIPIAPATSGGPVPMEASPSRGAIPDDVNARLEPGEFVVPKDVLRWKGEEFFQKTIEQSRKARQGATAKPQARPAIGGPPAFVSRPMAPAGGSGAIPMRA